MAALALATLWLLPGRHRVRIDVPDSRCCDPVDTDVTVAEADGGLQRFVFHLSVRPASVVVLEGPDDGILQCPGLPLVARVGDIESAEMSLPEWVGRCTFREGRHTVASGEVRLRAGELNAVLWPAE
jgi:hypothetical protein